MKTYIILLVFCCLANISHQAMSRKQRRDIFLMMAKECGKKENALIPDLVDILMTKLPKSNTGKCFLACIGETIGIIKDNKVDIAINLELAGKAFDGDSTKIQQASQLANDCVKVTHADRCEAAYRIFDCGYEAGKARGFQFEDIY